MYSHEAGFVVTYNGSPVLSIRWPPHAHTPSHTTNALYSLYVLHFRALLISLTLRYYTNTFPDVTLEAILRCKSTHNNENVG